MVAIQVCMVTGAARGLGYEFCRAFVDSYISSRSLNDGDR
jgi:NAD(P)-dependent dehydrogenase (short-subunit alcohol dehydrogenase family)